MAVKPGHHVLYHHVVGPIHVFVGKPDGENTCSVVQCDFEEYLFSNLCRIIIYVSFMLLLIERLQGRSGKGLT